MTSTSKLLRHAIRASGYASTNAAANAASVSQAYASQVLAGQKLPSADWLNTVASAWGLSEAERIKLHRAAAQDLGFEIDLTEGKKK